MSLPFNSCIECLKRSDCPIMIPGLAGKILVPKPSECIMDQLDEKNLVALATQLENRLGLLEVDREKQGRQLEMVLKFMETRNKKVIIG